MTNADLERRIQDLQVLQGFASTLLHDHAGVDDILWDVARLAVARLGLEDCVIYLLDEEHGDLVQRAAFGPKNPKEREILNPIRLPVGQGIVGSVVSSGRVERVEDTRRDARYVQDDQRRLSELAVPIFHQGRVIGVIDSEHSEVGFFTQWHEDLFVAIAAMAAIRITAVRLAEQRTRLATRDVLTGLVNRGELFRELQRMLDRASGTVAVMFLDLDHFGVINDSLSHLAGDDLLRTVGERIQRQLPTDGVAARFGGDEFVVAFPAEPAMARDRAETILRVVSTVLRGGAIDGLRVDCSAGLAMGAMGQSASDLIHQADLAMYHAKQSGGGRVQMHDAALAASRRREQRLVVDLLRALDQGGSEIEVHFQPIQDLSTGALAGAEVLARWRHPELGAVAPPEFVAAAERTGNIHELGRHLFAIGLERIAAWSARRPDLVFNLNVSPLQVQHEGFASQLLDQMRVAGVPCNMIACELTESALLGDEARVTRVLHSLVSQGVSLVLDDFGTGYASLGTLVRHPFSGIKIDRRFVQHMLSDRAAGAVVRSVVALSRDLGISCTAEGVERDDQLAVLRAMGCPRGQGWMLSRPLRADAFEAMLSSL